MQAGKLNRRIKIEREEQTKGARGGVTKSWIEVAEVWAAVRNISGVEKDATGRYGGVVSVARTEFAIRPRNDVDATMRINFKGITYGIVHVNDVLDAHDRMVLTCDTGAKDGA